MEETFYKFKLSEIGSFSYKQLKKMEDEYPFILVDDFPVDKPSFALLWLKCRLSEKNSNNIKKQIKSIGKLYSMDLTDFVVDEIYADIDDYDHNTIDYDKEVLDFMIQSEIISDQFSLSLKNNLTNKEVNLIKNSFAWFEIDLVTDKYLNYVKKNDLGITVEFDELETYEFIDRVKKLQGYYSVTREELLTPQYSDIPVDEIDFDYECIRYTENDYAGTDFVAVVSLPYFKKKNVDDDEWMAYLEETYYDKYLMLLRESDIQFHEFDFESSELKDIEAVKAYVIQELKNNDILTLGDFMTKELVYDDDED